MDRMRQARAECWSCKANRSKCRSCGDLEFWGYCNSCWEARVDKLTPPVEQAMEEGYKTMNHTKAEFEAHKEWRKPTGAEADAIEKATCAIDDGPACPMHTTCEDVCPACDGTGRLPYGHGFTCETDGQQA